MINDINKLEWGIPLVTKSETKSETSVPGAEDQVSETRTFTIEVDQGIKMGDEVIVRNMKDYFRPKIDTTSSYIVLPIAAKGYELKGQYFNLLPSFHRGATDDLLNFIRDYLTIVQYFPLTNGITEDHLKLRCFFFTLKDVAKNWFITLEHDSIDTREKIYQAFM